MKKTDLQVSFDTDKLNALQFYMEKKELNVEDELQECLEKLYEKKVPVQVREYIESKAESEDLKQESDVEMDTIKKEIKEEENISEQGVKANEEKVKERPVKHNKRQHEKEQVDVTQSEPRQEQSVGVEEVEEENQGMSMSM